MGDDAIWWADGANIGKEYVATFAHGMRHVAFADGHLNARELSVLASFESALGTESEVQGQLPEELEEAFVQALLLVAFADGGMTQSERWVIEHLLEEQGIPKVLLEQNEPSVKQLFVDRFAGRAMFRSAVVRVAEDMGLPEESLAALRAEA